MENGEIYHDALTSQNSGTEIKLVNHDHTRTTTSMAVSELKTHKAILSTQS